MGLFGLLFMNSNQKSSDSLPTSLSLHATPRALNLPPRLPRLFRFDPLSSPPVAAAPPPSPAVLPAALAASVLAPPLLLSRRQNPVGAFRIPLRPVPSYRLSVGLAVCSYVCPRVVRMWPCLLSFRCQPCSCSWVCLPFPLRSSVLRPRRSSMCSRRGFRRQRPWPTLSNPQAQPLKSNPSCH